MLRQVLINAGMLSGGEWGYSELVRQASFEFLEYLINLAVRAGAIDYPGGDIRLLLIFPFRLFPFLRILHPHVPHGSDGRA